MQSKLDHPDVGHEACFFSPYTQDVKKAHSVVSKICERINEAIEEINENAVVSGDQTTTEYLSSATTHCTRLEPGENKINNQVRKKCIQSDLCSRGFSRLASALGLEAEMDKLKMYLEGNICSTVHLLDRSNHLQNMKYNVERQRDATQKIIDLKKTKIPQCIVTPTTSCKQRIDSPTAAKTVDNVQSSINVIQKYSTANHPNNLQERDNQRDDPFVNSEFRSSKVLHDTRSRPSPPDAVTRLLTTTQQSPTQTTLHKHTKTRQTDGNENSGQLNFQNGQHCNQHASNALSSRSALKSFCDQAIFGSDLEFVEAVQILTNAVRLKQQK